MASTVVWAGQSRFEGCQGVSISALQDNTRQLCGQYLDQPLLLNRISSQGHQMDWVGLAEFMGFDTPHIQTFGERDMTARLIQEWSSEPGATLGTFLVFLEGMERYDLLENETLQTNILHDVEEYEHDERRRVRRQSALGLPHNTAAQVEERYDVYLLAADKDLPFAEEFLKDLEKQGFRVYFKDRNLMPGSPLYEELANVVAHKCNKLIILLSPNFYGSDECDFIMKYGHYLWPGGRERKVIPIKISDPVEVPDILKILVYIDFTRPETRKYIWPKLITCLRQDPSENCQQQRANEERQGLSNAQQSGAVGIPGSYRPVEATSQGPSSPGRTISIVRPLSRVSTYQIRHETVTEVTRL